VAPTLPRQSDLATASGSQLRNLDQGAGVGGSVLPKPYRAKVRRFYLRGLSIASGSLLRWPGAWFMVQAHAALC